MCACVDTGSVPHGRGLRFSEKKSPQCASDMHSDSSPAYCTTKTTTAPPSDVLRPQLPHRLQEVLCDILVLSYCYKHHNDRGRKSIEASMINNNNICCRLNKVEERVTGFCVVPVSSSSR